MSIFQTIAIRIIKEQELIVGPLAWEEAHRVSGLKFGKTQEVVDLEDDKKEVINRLVKQYSRLFGRASEMVCKDAVRDIISELSEAEIPSSLKE